MKERINALEIPLTATLALLLGFFLAAGGELNGGGYLGFGVEGAALDVFIDWTTPGIYLSTLLYALIVFAALMLLWRALDWISVIRAKRIIKKNPLDPTDPGTVGTLKIKKRWFWVGALALLCLWIPFWLALWPGIFNYDAHFQYEMVSNESLQTHHPLLHTLLLNGCILLGQQIWDSANVGVSLYLGVVLIISALTYSWMLFTMAEEGAGKVLLACSFIFLSVNPAFVVWLISANKDALFVVFLILATLMLYRACRFRKRELAEPMASQPGALPWENNAAGHAFRKFFGGDKLRIGGTFALALFWVVLLVLALRTSAVYSLLVFLPFALILIRRYLRVRLVGVMASAAAVFIVVYLLLTQIIFQIPSGPWQTLDALSIPRQQLARVWVQTEDPATRAAYEQVFEPSDLALLEEYEADNADTSRKAFRSAFEEDPSKLLALYLEMAPRYPGTFTDAALLTNYEAWYPGAVSDGYVLEGNFSKPGEARGCYIDVSAFPPAEEAWILADFGAWLKQFGLSNVGMDLAPVRLLCSPAVYVWILLVAFVRTLCVRNRRGALACTLLLVFTLTAFLSPLVVMRYFLMTMAATPLLLHLASSPSWKTGTVSIRD